MMNNFYFTKEDGSTVPCIVVQKDVRGEYSELHHFEDGTVLRHYENRMGDIVLVEGVETFAPFSETSKPGCYSKV